MVSDLILAWLATKERRVTQDCICGQGRKCAWLGMSLRRIQREVNWAHAGRFSVSHHSSRSRAGAQKCGSCCSCFDGSPKPFHSAGKVHRCRAKFRLALLVQFSWSPAPESMRSLCPVPPCSHFQPPSPATASPRPPENPKSWTAHRPRFPNEVGQPLSAPHTQQALIGRAVGVFGVVVEPAGLAIRQTIQTASSCKNKGPSMFKQALLQRERKRKKKKQRAVAQWSGKEAEG